MPPPNPESVMVESFRKVVPFSRIKSVRVKLLFSSRKKSRLPNGTVSKRRVLVPDMTACVPGLSLESSSEVDLWTVTTLVRVQELSLDEVELSTV